MNQKDVVMYDEDPRGVDQDTWNGCMQASVATYLGLPLDEVPNFMDSENWWDVFRQFFARMASMGTRAVPLAWAAAVPYRNTATRPTTVPVPNDGRVRGLAP